MPAHSLPTSTGGTGLAVTTIVFSVISILAVLLRIWAMILRKARVKSHDYFAFAALAFILGFGVCTLLAVYEGGAGIHLATILENAKGRQIIEFILKDFFAIFFVWTTATVLCKLSMLCFYAELFPLPRFLQANYVMMFLTISFWIILVVKGFTRCHPLAKNWDQRIPGTCGTRFAEEIGTATSNLVLDGAIVTLPMPFLWRLQMPLKKKIIATFMLGLGLSICAVNIARIVIVTTANEEDFTYPMAPITILVGLEVWLGILAICIPTYGALMYKKTRSTSTPSGYIKQSRTNRSNGSDDDGKAGPLLDAKRGPRNSTVYQILDDDDILLRDALAAEAGTMRVHAEGKSENVTEEESGSLDAINVRVDIDIESCMRGKS